MDGVTTFLKDSRLSDGFWAEALLHFWHTRNNVCREGQNKTHFECYMERTPSVKHLRAFGTVVYVRAPRQQNQICKGWQKDNFSRYAKKTMGYRIWISESKKLVD